MRKFKNKPKKIKEVKSTDNVNCANKKSIKNYIIPIIISIIGMLIMVGATTFITDSGNSIYSSNITSETNNSLDLGSSTSYFRNTYTNILNVITQLTDSQISNDITANASRLIEKENLANTHTHTSSNLSINNNIDGNGYNLNNFTNITATNFIGTSSYLNVNKSDYWDTLGSINSTQLEDSGTILNIKESWMNSLWCQKTGCIYSGSITNITNVFSINISTTNMTVDNINSNINLNDHNITQNQGYYHCFNSTCGSRVYDNGTDLVMEKL